MTDNTFFQILQLFFTCCFCVVYQTKNYLRVTLGKVRVAHGNSQFIKIRYPFKGRDRFGQQ